MFGDTPTTTPQRIGFLMLPGFSMIGLSAMIDPLRWANTLAKEPLYEWQMLSLRGRPVRSSNDISLMADKAVETVEGIDTLVVCAGFLPQTHFDNKLASALRRLAAVGVDLGGQDTGSYLLAAAGLVIGKIEPHDHHTVQVIDLAGAQVVLGDGHVSRTHRLTGPIR